MNRSRLHILIVLTVWVAPLIIHFYARKVLLLQTRHYDPAVMILIALAAFAYALYIVKRYLKERQEKTAAVLIPALVLAMLLWSSLALNYDKVLMLITNRQNQSIKAELTILNIEEDKTKGNLNGGKISAVIEGEAYTLYTNRVAYFALKDKERVSVDFGRTPDGRNLFITRLYLSAAEQAAAQSADDRYGWDRRNAFLMGATGLAIVLLFTYLFHRRKKISGT